MMFDKFLCLLAVWQLLLTLFDKFGKFGLLLFVDNLGVQLFNARLVSGCCRLVSGSHRLASGRLTGIHRIYLAC